MRVFHSLLVASALALVSAAPALAESAADLGKSLTPFGAIKAGNADGSIPAWSGGITSPPGGYSPGSHHADPYAADQIQFSISAGNVDQYASKLSPGQIALLKAYPDYKMNVYQTRRSASAPQRVYDAAIANASKAQLIDNGNGVEGATVGVPFPVPQNGQQAIWNHLLRWRGESLTRRVGQANPSAGGDYVMIMFEDKILLRYSQPDFDPSKENINQYLLQQVVAPASKAGELLLVHDTLNQIAEARKAWVYNPGQRRVRLAPNVAYDNPGTQADGQRTSDNLDMFNGAIDQYDWKLQGRVEMYVPYNDYKLHSSSLSYDDIIKPGHLNPDHLRYELHRVWKVEATLKPGKRNIYSKRTFYIDEDSWQILVADHYDSSGKIWRVGESYGINYYDVPAYWSTVDAFYDLANRRYTAIGFDNQERMYNFRANLAPKEFSISNLRNSGVR